MDEHEPTTGKFEELEADIDSEPTTDGTEELETEITVEEAEEKIEGAEEEVRKTLQGALSSSIDNVKSRAMKFISAIDRMARGGGGFSNAKEDLKALKQEAESEMKKGVEEAESKIDEKKDEAETELKDGKQDKMDKEKESVFDQEPVFDWEKGGDITREDIIEDFDIKKAEQEIRAQIDMLQHAVENERISYDDFIKKGDYDSRVDALKEKVSGSQGAVDRAEKIERLRDYLEIAKEGQQNKVENSDRQSEQSNENMQNQEVVEGQEENVEGEQERSENKMSNKEKELVGLSRRIAKAETLLQSISNSEIVEMGGEKRILNLESSEIGDDLSGLIDKINSEEGLDYYLKSGDEIQKIEDVKDKDENFSKSKKVSIKTEGKSYRQSVSIDNLRESGSYDVFSSDNTSKTVEDWLNQVNEVVDIDLDSYSIDDNKEEVAQIEHVLELELKELKKEREDLKEEGEEESKTISLGDFGLEKGSKYNVSDGETTMKLEVEEVNMDESDNIMLTVLDEEGYEYDIKLDEFEEYRTDSEESKNQEQRSYSESEEDSSEESSESQEADGNKPKDGQASDSEEVVENDDKEQEKSGSDDEEDINSETSESGTYSFEALDNLSPDKLKAIDDFVGGEYDDKEFHEIIIEANNSDIIDLNRVNESGIKSIKKDLDNRDSQKSIQEKLDDYEGIDDDTKVLLAKVYNNFTETSKNKDSDNGELKEQEDSGLDSCEMKIDGINIKFEAGKQYKIHHADSENDIFFIKNINESGDNIEIIADKKSSSKNMEGVLTFLDKDSREFDDVEQIQVRSDDEEDWEDHNNLDSSESYSKAA